MLKLKFSMFLMWMYYLILTQGYAVTLNNFSIMNGDQKSIVLLDFRNMPVYKFYILHHPERLVLDISYDIIPINPENFPVNFHKKNMIHCIRANKFLEKNSVRFVFDLSYVSCVDDILLENIEGCYTVLLVITRHILLSNINTLGFVNSQGKEHSTNSCVKLLESKSTQNTFSNYRGNTLSKSSALCQMKMFDLPIVVAIDAGHGGYDPGARGCSGLYEKDITMAIAKKFKKLLDADPAFNPVMIREGDYFISVFKRSELARNKGAKILLSIHTNAISNNIKSNVRGASVWVLSDRRANMEVTEWLGNSNKWSQLSGIGDILSSSVNSDPYFNRMILDLQFSHSQRVGYKVASYILRELKDIGMLYKYMPEYSNFGILRSLDIPSVLVETGFITHAGEEKLLASDYYQEKIARALYNGLRAYFVECLSCIEGKIHDRSFWNFRNINKRLML